MNDHPFPVDLHGFTRDEAMRRFGKALCDAGSGVYPVHLVHGCHRGTGLRSVIQGEYRYHEKGLQIMPGDDPGIAILVLEELY